VSLAEDSSRLLMRDTKSGSMTGWAETQAANATCASFIAADARVITWPAAASTTDTSSVNEVFHSALG